MSPSDPGVASHLTPKPVVAGRALGEPSPQAKEIAASQHNKT